MCFRVADRPQAAIRRRQLWSRLSQLNSKGVAVGMFSRAFDGVPLVVATTLELPAAMAALGQLKRWAPGKPLLTGEIQSERIVLAFAPGSGYGRAPSRYEGVLESSPSGCVLRGRFVSSGSVRTTSAFMIVMCAFMALGGMISGLSDAFAEEGTFIQIGMKVLVVGGWLLAVGLFGSLILWNAAPGHSEVRDMTKHLQSALDADQSAAGSAPSDRA